MRILIVGGGEIGFALARALAPRHAISVVDHERQVADRFSSLDVDFVIGSGTSAATLRQAGADACEMFVACTGLDEVNIVACAIASRLGSPQTICVVSKEDFLRPVGETDILRQHFGIQRVLWPEAQLADDIERILAAPGAIDAEFFAGGRIRLLEYRLEPGSPFDGLVSDLHLPPGTLIVAVRHDDRFLIPRGSTRLVPGDKIFLMGTQDAMREVQARATGGRAPARQAITIVGGGDVGFRLAQRLDRDPDVELRIIERDPRRGEMLASQLRRPLVLLGDGTDLELLEAEGIGRSDALVSVIDNDERNLLASLLGRQLGVGKVITRVSKPANLRLFERVGVNVALSARGAAVAAMIHQVEGGTANLLAVLEEGQAKIVELAVPDGYPRTALRDLHAPPESIVGAILRGGTIVVPRGSDWIQEGDHLLVFSTAASADRVRDFFGSSGGG